jgi:hypothetical protein
MMKSLGRLFWVAVAAVILWSMAVVLSLNSSAALINRELTK